MSCLPLHRSVSVVTRLLVIAVLACLVTAPAVAQVTSGTIFGSVKDPSGAAVKGAAVTITNPENGITREVMTSDTGEYVAPGLYPGTYSITVNAKGFRKSETTGIALSAADKLNAGATVLTVGAATESVTVMADAGQIQLQSNSGERSDLITGKQLNDIALNGRNVLDYMKLIPGVASTFSGQVSGTGGIDQFNINGTRSNQHEFTLDGASNVDTGNNGGTHVTLNPDAIDEVKVLTSNYQAEFGKAAGGQVAVTTKSGSNQFHGNVRFFHRNEGLNANEWFANQNQTPIAKYRYNYFGYQFGGPIKKDKLFFFWSQEFYRQLVPINGLTTFYTPTDLERKGDFSQSKDASGNPIVVYDPTTGNPFPGNKIDRNALSTAQQAVFDQMVKVLGLFPEPNVSNQSTYNYSTALSYTDPRREDIARVDYQLNGKNRIYGRWIHNSDNLAAPFTPGGLGAVDCLAAINFPGGCLQQHPGWNLSVNLTSTIRPNLLNEFSIGPSVTKSKVTGANGNISPKKNGINLPLMFPISSDTSIPDFSFNGIPNVNYGWSYLGSMPWYQSNTTINVNDNLTWVRQRHTLKFGFFYQRSRKDQIAWGNANGQFNYGTGPTGTSSCAANTQCGDPYASALLGYFDSFDQDSSRPRGFFRYNQLEFYVQDTWKVTNRLTLDYGMRFAWIPPQYDAKNQIAVFDPNSYRSSSAVRLYYPDPAGSGGVYDPANPGVIIPDPHGALRGSVVPNSGNPLNGMKFAANGYEKGGWDSRGIMPEPRLGFAYDLLGDHKTVLRGGFGMMHDRVQGNLIFNPVFNNPALVTTATVYNNQVANLPSLASTSAEQPLNNIIAAEKSGKVPTVYSFSFGVQRELGRGTTLDLAYVGNAARHLVTQRNLNQIPYNAAFLAVNQDPSKYPGGVVPAVEANLPTAYSAAGFNYAGDNSYDAIFLAPYAGLGTVVPYYKFDGTSNYNSLQASLQRRFSQGLTLGAVYTWSKAMTTSSSDQMWTDPFFFRKFGYAVANFDRTHVLAFNYVYDLPKLTKHFGGPKWLGYLTDNYQLSGVTNFMTGAPLTDPGIWWPPSNTVNGSFNAYWVGWKDGAFLLYPQITGNVNHRVGTSKYNPAAFAAPNIGTPKGYSIGALRGGGLQNWDVSLFKNIPFGSNEARSLQLRLETFNVFNHPNFQNVNLNWGLNGPSGTSPLSLALNTRASGCTGGIGSCFGEYNSTYNGQVGGPRIVQLAAKFYF